MPSHEVLSVLEKIPDEVWRHPARPNVTTAEENTCLQLCLELQISHAMAPQEMKKTSIRGHWINMRP